VARDVENVAAFAGGMAAMVTVDAAVDGVMIALMQQQQLLGHGTAERLPWW